MDELNKNNECDEITSSESTPTVSNNDSTVEQSMHASEISSSERAPEKTTKVIKIMLVTTIISLIISVIGNAIQYCSHQTQLRQYKEQQTPELDCWYNYNSIKDILSFTIRNVGLVDARSVWAKESVFMIIDGQVYEGVDVPHFNYLVYNGSRENMWDISRDKNQPIELPKLQRKAFDYLMNRFQTEIISKWTISYTSITSQKRYSFEAYFLHSLTDRLPRILINTTGGTRKRDRILNYIASGPINQIRIFDLTNDFELNTPIHYRITKDYSIHPLNSWTTLSVEDYNKTIRWSVIGEPQVADDVKGSIKYIWEHKNGEWYKWISIKGKTHVMTQVIKTPCGYLNSDDTERVKHDPTLLKPFINDPIKEKEIRNRLRDNFIKKRIR